jgi:c-di-GMP-binding flagellar brake protein YcgR
VYTEGPGSLQLTAVVDGVDGDGRLELGCIDATRTAALRPGLVVYLEYFREGAVYKVRTSVEEVGPQPDPSHIKARRRVVVAPAEVNKVQRRRFTRAYVSVYVAFTPVNDPGSDFDITSKKGKKQAAAWAEALESMSRSTFTETLSASGLRMRIDVPAEKGDFLYVQLDLPDHQVAAVGEVVWLGAKPPQEVPGEAVGIDFKSISDADRQAILDFVKRP